MTWPIRLLLEFVDDPYRRSHQQLYLRACRWLRNALRPISGARGSVAFMKWNWRADLGRGAIYTALFCLCLLGSWGAYRLPIERGEVMAAWFQGFGTVAAICLTLAISFRAENRLTKAAAATRVKFLRELELLSKAADNIFVEIEDSIITPNKYKFIRADAMANDIRRAFHHLVQLPVQNWPSPFLLVAVDLMAQAFDVAVTEAWTFGADVENHVVDVPKLKRWDEKRKDFATRAEVLALQITSIRTAGET